MCGVEFSLTLNYRTGHRPLQPSPHSGEDIERIVILPEPTMTLNSKAMAIAISIGFGILLVVIGASTWNQACDRQVQAFLVSEGAIAVAVGLVSSNQTLLDAHQ